MAIFKSRFDWWLFIASSITFLVAFLYIGFVGGFQAINYTQISYLVNNEGYIPLSDAFELGTIDPNALSLSSPKYGEQGINVVSSDDQNFRINHPFTVYMPEVSPLTGETYHYAYIDGGGILSGQAVNPTGSTIRIEQDLRGKKAQFSYLAAITTESSGNYGTIVASSNCGSKDVIPRIKGSSTQAEGKLAILSSNLDESLYTFLVNGNFVCGGQLKPGEKLNLQITIRGDKEVLIGYDFKWLMPFQCSFEEGLDLVEEVFQSGQTVTLTGATQRWPQAMCHEFPPVLLNESSKGATDLRELFPLLASPKKDDKPYVVPYSCRDDNSGGCQLILRYWTYKDPSLPTPCYDLILQQAFNMNDKECRDMISIRTFCTNSKMVNNQCISSSNTKANFNFTGTLDLNQKIPECAIYQTQTDVTAYCRPGDGGYNSNTGNCTKIGTNEQYAAYNSFREACDVIKGVVEGDKCLQKDLAITLVDKPSNAFIGSGSYNSPSQSLNTNNPSAFKNCEKYLPDGTCSTITTIEDLQPGTFKAFLEGYHQFLWWTYKTKMWLLYIGFVGMLISLLRAPLARYFFKRRG